MDALQHVRQGSMARDILGGPLRRQLPQHGVAADRGGQGMHGGGSGRIAGRP